MVRRGIDPIFEDRNTPKWRRYVIIAILLGIIAFLIFAAFAGSDKDVGPVPIIRADETPWTREPEEPGGMEIPNQDSTVFELMRDDETGEAAIEKSETSAPEPKEEAEVEEVKKVEDVIERNEVKAVEQEVTKPETTIADIIEDTVTQAVSDGTVTLRLGAVRGSDQAVAQSEFERLQKLSDGVLNGKTATFQLVSLPEQGDFVRINVRVDEGEADSICKALRDKNAPCLVLQ